MTVSSPKETVISFRSLIEQKGLTLDWMQEHLMVLFLDVKNHVRNLEVVHIGDFDGAPCYPRTVLRRVLINGVANFIVVHNHPSGNPEPSSSDVAMTRRLEEASNVIGLELLDHLIIGNDEEGNVMRYVSMKDRGIF